MGAELFHAGGRTDMTKLIVAFRNFANAPKNCVGDWQTPNKDDLKGFDCGILTLIFKNMQ